MNIFIDVDYTILGFDGSLRPGTREVLERLKADGHSIYIWSGVGIRKAEVWANNLQDLVTDIFQKPLNNYESGMEALGIPVRPDLVVDDYPDIVSTLGGIQILPYYGKNTPDDEMERMYDIITEYARTGFSKDSRFRPNPKKHTPEAPG